MLTSLALSRATLDRAAYRRRDDTWLAAAWQHPDTQIALVALSSGTVAVSTDRTSLAFVTSGMAPAGERLFLGVDGGRAVFAVMVEGEQPDFASLREAGAVLEDREAGIAVHAIGLANWHATHPRCARCGAATSVADAGHTRICPSCGAQHFPRSDPAIIVLVTDSSDRALLGRQDSWPEGRFSTLAGFVEPGESLEAAVRREVQEETGVLIGDDIRYVGSQPWPFPSSLMLGFFAVATSVEIAVDNDEISEADWFSRADLLSAIDAGKVKIPGSISISRRLIESWYGADLPGHW